MYANRCQIVLGNAGLELTREPVASNVTEVFVWEKIVGVIPAFVEEAPHYRFPNITEIVIVMDTGNKLTVELQEVTNQPMWSGGTKADLDQFISDTRSYYGGVPGYIVAEGGIATRDGDYIVRTFPAGTSDVTILSNGGNFPLQYLFTGGGAAGGATNNGGAGGGGGAEVIESSFIPTVRSYAAVIGTGGLIQSQTFGANGNDSTFETESGTRTAKGGGGGGSGGGFADPDTRGNGQVGASGGGMGYNKPVKTGFGIGAKGHDGGAYINGDYGAGGGGFNSAGTDATSTNVGDGGDGWPSAISGTLKYYGCGGGGGAYFFGAGTKAGGLGGNSTGGNGGGILGGVYVEVTPPVANSGSGAGGAGSNNTGGKDSTSGSDGCLIVRYYSPAPIVVYSLETILSDAD